MSIGEAEPHILRVQFAELFFRMFGSESPHKSTLPLHDYPIFYCIVWTSIKAIVWGLSGMIQRREWPDSHQSGHLHRCSLFTGRFMATSPLYLKLTVTLSSVCLEDIFLPFRHSLPFLNRCWTHLHDHGLKSKLKV